MTKNLKSYSPAAFSPRSARMSVLLESNLTAAFFRVETQDMAEALPDLYRQLKDRLPPRDSALRRTVAAWFTGVVQRTVQRAIISEGISLREPPMLEE